MHLLWARHCSRSQSLSPPQENRSYTLYRVKERIFSQPATCADHLAIGALFQPDVSGRDSVWRDRPALMQLLLLGTLWAVHNLYNCTRRAPITTQKSVDKQHAAWGEKLNMGGVQGQGHLQGGPGPNSGGQLYRDQQETHSRQMNRQVPWSSIRRAGREGGSLKTEGMRKGGFRMLSVFGK